MTTFVADRLLLNALIEAAAMRPANENLPSKTEQEVVARRTPPKPSASYRQLSARLARRQEIGDPRADNDNQGWPLAEQLRRDGNDVLLQVAERYQHIYRAAIYEPKLVGTVADDFWSPEQYHSIDSKTGKLKIDGQKSSKAARAMPVNNGTYKVAAVTDDVAEEIMRDGPVTFHRRPKMPVIGKWNGDAALIAAIDARPMLARLQAALGPLLDPFEDAVISGMTLSDIGRQKGGNSVSSGPIGRAFVMDGLEIVQRELAAIDRTSAA